MHVGFDKYERVQITTVYYILYTGIYYILYSIYTMTAGKKPAETTCKGREEPSIYSLSQLQGLPYHSAKKARARRQRMPAPGASTATSLGAHAISHAHHTTINRTTNTVAHGCDSSCPLMPTRQCVLSVSEMRIFFCLFPHLCVQPRTPRAPPASHASLRPRNARVRRITP